MSRIAGEVIRNLNTVPTHPLGFWAPGRIWITWYLIEPGWLNRLNSRLTGLQMADRILLEGELVLVRKILWIWKKQSPIASNQLPTLFFLVFLCILVSLLQAGIFQWPWHDVQSNGYWRGIWTCCHGFNSNAQLMTVSFVSSRITLQLLPLGTWKETNIFIERKLQYQFLIHKFLVLL